MDLDSGRDSLLESKNIFTPKLNYFAKQNELILQEYLKDKKYLESSVTNNLENLSKPVPHSPKGYVFGTSISGLGIFASLVETYRIGIPQNIYELFTPERNIFTLGIFTVMAGIGTLCISESYNPLKIIETIGKITCLPYDLAKQRYIKNKREKNN